MSNAYEEAVAAALAAIKARADRTPPKAKPPSRRAVLAVLRPGAELTEEQIAALTRPRGRPRGRNHADRAMMAAAMDAAMEAAPGLGLYRNDRRDGETICHAVAEAMREAGRGTRITYASVETEMKGLRRFGRGLAARLPGAVARAQAALARFRGSR